MKKDFTISNLDDFVDSIMGVALLHDVTLSYTLVFDYQDSRNAEAKDASLFYNSHFTFEGGNKTYKYHTSHLLETTDEAKEILDANFNWVLGQLAGANVRFEEKDQKSDLRKAFIPSRNSYTLRD